MTAPTEPRDQFFDTDGLRLHYLDWGDPTNEPIVFLHGGGLTAHTWDRVCARLADRYRCVALDQRGHGESDWSPDLRYGLPDYVADLVALTRHLDLDRFTLVGMSLGAFNCLGYALEHESTLERLVLIDIAPRLVEAGIGRLNAFVNLPPEAPSVEDFVTRAVAFNPRRDPEVLRRSLLKNLRRTPDGTWTWKYDRRRGERNHQPEAVAARAALRQELWARAAELTVPVLVVRGGESDVTVREDMIAASDRIPNGRFVEVPDAGHTVQGDNPEVLTAELLAFLNATVS